MNKLLSPKYYSLITFVILCFICFFFLLGCNIPQKSKFTQIETDGVISTDESEDKKKVKEALSVYQLYRDGSLTSEIAMQQIIILSQDIKDYDLANQVANMTFLLAHDEITDADDTEAFIEKLMSDLENSTSITKDVENNQTPKEILKEASSFLSDCWNPICDLDWYISRGTDSVGGELDAEFTIVKFKNAYKKRDNIYSKVNSLSDEYALAKMAFNNAIKEFDRLDKIIEDSAYILNNNNSGKTLGIHKLEDYVRTFSHQKN